MFARTKPLYGLSYEQNAVRVRNIPSCVLSSGISRVKTCESLPMGEFIGSLYTWLRLVASYKVPKSFLTVVPDGLVRYPDPYPLQANTKRVRFE